MFLFFVYLALISVIVFLYLDNLFIECLCDSTSHHDFVIEDTDKVPSEHEVSKIFRLYNSFKCRLSWFVDKNNGISSSYNEYKKSWNTSIRLRDIIKADLAKSRSDTLASINKKKLFDKQVWEAKWARRANEAQRDYVRREKMYNFNRNNK